jgi:hypothetical protein
MKGFTSPKRAKKSSFRIRVVGQASSRLPACLQTEGLARVRPDGRLRHTECAYYFASCRLCELLPTCARSSGLRAPSPPRGRRKGWRVTAWGFAPQTGWRPVLRRQPRPRNDFCAVFAYNHTWIRSPRSQATKNVDVPSTIRTACSANSPSSFAMHLAVRIYTKLLTSATTACSGGLLAGCQAAPPTTLLFVSRGFEARVGLAFGHG